MKVLITGANGFIGKNLTCRLSTIPGLEILSFTREDDEANLASKIAVADTIVHLAGVNRPKNEDEFQTGNKDLTATICQIAAETGRSLPILFTSSIQTSNDSPYGKSKIDAEDVLTSYANATDSAVTIFRLPNIMGKWCRPNYNSVVATFCHNMSHGLPIRVDDEEAVIQINYIDDLVDSFVVHLTRESANSGQAVFANVEPVYEVTLKTLVELLKGFASSRTSLQVDAVGMGFKRALYATYTSYLDESDFSYPLVSNTDVRGNFVEFIKTGDSGQVSYFTAKPGVTRGQHYHHTKTEKFLVVQGAARFRYRHLLNDKYHELEISASKPSVVESIPGWTHDVTNIGNELLVVLLWSSEVFDKNRPDTIPGEI